jgi:hypothetical protein
MALVHRVGWDAAWGTRSHWFWPLYAAAERFASLPDWPSRADFDALWASVMHGQDLKPLRFCDNVRKQDKRADGQVVISALYDARITLAGEVPTRERDWHDLFNATCFASFPRSKLALHARQYHALLKRLGNGAQQLPKARTPEQDALTLFDEGGVVLAVEPDLCPQLLAAEGEARAALCTQRILEQRTRVVPFGHALFEHLVEGLRCPGGCTQIVAVPQLWSSAHTWLPQLDRALAQAIADPQRFRTPRECSHVRLETLQLFALRA